MDCQPRLGFLQRDQRRLDVAGDLQLLRGQRHRLLDLGDHAVLAAARKLLVQGFERSGLTFGGLDLGLKGSQLALQRGDDLLLLADNAARLGRDRLALGQAPGQFLAQLDRLHARIPRLPDGPARAADRDQGEQQRPPRVRAAPRLAGIPGGGRRRRRGGLRVCTGRLARVLADASLVIFRGRMLRRRRRLDQGGNFFFHGLGSNQSDSQAPASGRHRRRASPRHHRTPLPAPARRCGGAKRTR